MREAARRAERSPEQDLVRRARELVEQVRSSRRARVRARTPRQRRGADPGLGSLDDAVMVELIVRDLKHEVDAHRDFCRFRERQERRRGPEAPATRGADKRRQMFMRMQRRREESEAGHRFRRQPLIISYRGRLAGG